MLIVYLKDIADVKDDFLDRESYARLNHKNVLTLNIIKKSGENLLDASDKIKDIIDELKETKLPSKLNVVYTGEQAKVHKKNPYRIKQYHYHWFYIGYYYPDVFHGIYKCFLCWFICSAFYVYCLYCLASHRVYDEHACNVFLHFCAWHCGG